MKISSRHILLTSIISTAAALALASTSHAQAPIVWTAPTTIVGDTDVSTFGVFKYAFNLGTTAIATTVNTVPFTGVGFANDGTTGSSGNASFTLAYTNRESSDTAYGSAAAPYSGLSAAYKVLLSSGVGSNSPGSTLTLTLNTLTLGTPYVFQWRTNDSALAFGGFTTTATATNAVTLSENTTSTNGGVGQWSSGTFTAAGTSEIISFSGTRPELNSFQVRTIPEPSAMVLMFGSVGMLLGFKRFGRQARA